MAHKTPMTTPPPETYLVRRVDVAHFFKVSPGYVGQWIKAGMPVSDYYRGDQQLYDLRDVYWWHRENIKEPGRPQTRQSEEINKLKAQKLELDLQRARGTQVDGQVMAEVTGRYLKACQTRLLGLHVRITGRLGKVMGVKDPKKLGAGERLIKDSVREALEDLSRTPVSDLVSTS